MLFKTGRWFSTVLVIVALIPLTAAEQAEGQYRGRQGRQNRGQLPQSGTRPAVVLGTITAVSGTTTGTVTITPTNGTAVTLNVTAGTKIIRNRLQATLGNLQKNDQATVVYDANNNALVLQAHTQTSVVRGTITAISGTTTGTVTIIPANGTAVTVNITAGTKIIRNRQTATLADLQKNDQASATYDSSNNALRLEAHTKESAVRGTVTAISGNAVPATVTISPQSGAAVTVNITATTKITRNGKTATLADLQQNDKARAVYDASNNALILAAHGS
jgi:GTPase involved in cell partitioning and DNA repair